MKIVLSVVKLLLVFFSCSIFFANSESLSPLGFSGLGIIPQVRTIPIGQTTIAYDSTVPGAPNVKGYNYLLGFGLTNELELVGRLATNDLKCNLFISGACPSGTIRDLSASLKWKISNRWLDQSGVNLALGATDIGGAATYFRSYYAVASKNFGPIEVSIGNGKAKSEGALLDGPFGSVTFQANDWSKLSIQRTTGNTLVSVYAETPFLINSITGWMSFNQQLESSKKTDTNWMGVGLTLPLTSVPATTSPNANNPRITEFKEIKKFPLEEFEEKLKKNGFFKSKLGLSSSGKIIIQLDASAYSRNLLDASGVALALLAGAHTDKLNDKYFEITLSLKGIDQLQISGELNCVASWLETGNPCKELVIKSKLEGATTSIADTEIITWQEESGWKPRPEITLIPRIVSTLGTEYGTFDADFGVDINTVLPLWRGATYDNNRVRPLGFGTRNFEFGEIFYYSRILPLTTRSMLHQVAVFPELNSQVRVSLGKMNTYWQGTQLESNTQSQNGKHRVGLITGNFKNDLLTYNNERSYQLAKYRFASGTQLNNSTEVTYGKFWGQDKGYAVAQKFWFGDTSLSVYLRRTRVSQQSPLYSFAGLEISVPLTPRQNTGFESLLIKGPSQWSYALETRVLARENTIVGGFGVVPKAGETLIQTMNQDRNSSRYLELNLSRVRESSSSLIKHD